MAIIRNKKFLAKGHRSIIYTGFLGTKKIVIKEKNPSSEAIGRIKNEARFLKILNKYKIGPRLLNVKHNSIIYEFVEGDFILDFIEKNNKKKIVKMLKDVLRQCFILDKLKINKLEMHHPVKHIIIDKKPVLIDFERSYYTENPKNVSQFCQFLMSNSKDLKINRKELIFRVKNYKKRPSKSTFKGILDLIGKI
ncbi:hypothetical protein J4427_02555 [Candidatus Woesearchaeota archaeon]|nr:hypothetical protein [Candidatus Woesearchaeota archaeon]